MYVSGKVIPIMIAITMSISSSIQSTEQILFDSVDFLMNNNRKTISQVICANGDTDNEMNGKYTVDVNKEISEVDYITDKECEIQSFSAHTHTKDCYAGHVHDANCKLGFRCGCSTPRLHAKRGDGDFSNEIYFKCINCGAIIARIRGEYDKYGSGCSVWAMRNGVLQVVNCYWKCDYYLNPYTLGDINVQKYYWLANDWIVRDMPQTYDELYARMPLLISKSQYDIGRNYVGDKDYAYLYPEYNCAEQQCAGSTLSFIEENEILVSEKMRLAGRDLYIIMQIQKYKCSSCGKDLVYGYLGAKEYKGYWEYYVMPNFYILCEGTNAYDICIQEIINLRNSDYMKQKCTIMNTKGIRIEDYQEIISYFEAILQNQPVIIQRLERTPYIKTLVVTFLKGKYSYYISKRPIARTF